MKITLVRGAFVFTCLLGAAAASDTVPEIYFPTNNDSIDCSGDFDVYGHQDDGDLVETVEVQDTNETPIFGCSLFEPARAETTSQWFASCTPSGLTPGNDYLVHLTTTYGAEATGTFTCLDSQVLPIETPEPTETPTF